MKLVCLIYICIWFFDIDLWFYILLMIRSFGILIQQHVSLIKVLFLQKMLVNGIMFVPKDLKLMLSI